MNSTNPKTTPPTTTAAPDGRRRRVAIIQVTAALLVLIIGLVMAFKASDTVAMTRVTSAVAEIRGLAVLLNETRSRHSRLPGDCNRDGIIALAQPIGSRFEGVVSAPLVDAAEHSAAAMAVCPAAAAAASQGQDDAAVAAAQPGLANNHANLVWSELRRLSVADPNQTNRELALHKNHDLFQVGSLSERIGDKTIISNVIIMYGVPAWLAIGVEAQIDTGTASATPACSGRLRRWDGNAAPAQAGIHPFVCNNSAFAGGPNQPVKLNTPVAIVYLLDPV